MGKGGDRMISDLVSNLDPSVTRRFGRLAEEASAKRATAALEANGIKVLRAADAAGAKRMVMDLIPVGAQVNHGASQTLDMTGITAAIEKPGRYDLLRPHLGGGGRKAQGGRDPPPVSRAGRKPRQCARRHRDRIAAGGVVWRRPAR